MTAHPVVRLQGVSKSYQLEGEATPVLTDTDLAIEAGQKVSLIGPSGSGKSTLLSLIAGLLRADAGDIEIEGVSMAGLDERDRANLRARRIGIALQADNLIPFLTAAENVELALAFAGKPSRRAAQARSTDLLGRFGVGHRSTHVPRQLSGGEAQRVALAVAMANEPALLLADEVVAQLDGETAGHVIDEVLAAEFAVLFVTHSLALADLAEHRYVLEDQRVCRR